MTNEETKPVTMPEREALAAMSSSALKLLREDLTAESQAKLRKWAKEHDELGEVVETLKAAKGYEVELILRSPDGKTKKVFKREDGAGTAENTAAVIGDLLREAVSFVGGYRNRLGQVQHQRSDLKRKIQQEQQDHARRAWGINHEIEKAEEREKAAKAKSADVAKSVAAAKAAPPISETMTERLTRSGAIEAAE